MEDSIKLRLPARAVLTAAITMLDELG